MLRGRVGRQEKSVHGWLDDEEGDVDEDDDESGHMQVRLRGVPNGVLNLNLNRNLNLGSL